MGILDLSRHRRDPAIAEINPFESLLVHAGSMSYAEHGHDRKSAATPVALSPEPR
jgi:hypothetical protein